MVCRNAQEQVIARGLQRSRESNHGGLLFVEKERAKTTHYQLEKKEEEGKVSDAVTLVGLLRTCAEQKDLCKGIRLHDDVLHNGLLQNNLFIGNALITMYAKCGALVKAQHLFEALPVRNVVSWNALASGYAQHGHGKEALNCFELMQHEGLSPDAITFTCLLKACGSVQASERGEELHANIERKGYLGNGTILGNALIDMYAKCGALAKANRVFNQLSVRNVISWTSLITGYCKHGHGEEALKCFEQMKSDGLLPNTITFSSILKACGSIGATKMGEEIHTDMARMGLLGPDSVLMHSLVDMYGKCGALAKAQELFDLLVKRDVIIWTALIAGYCQHGLCEVALKGFQRMKHEGISPNATTLTCVLKCCGSTNAIDKGKETHAESIQTGFLDGDIVLGNALADMYSKCGALIEALEVFNKLSMHDVTSWSALIAGYCQHDRGEEALRSLKQMKCKGLTPDAVTYACVLQACSNLEAADEGMELHCEIARRGLLCNNIVLGNSLVDLYAKCGLLTKAQEAFDVLPTRNLVTWSVLICGYFLKGFGEEALRCFERMKSEHIFPDAVTFACILKACGSIGAAEKGVEMHVEIERIGLLGTDTVLSSALVDMYAKCGVLAKAQEVFGKLPVRDVVSWSVLITGYYQHGHVKEALNCFEQMKIQGITPDDVAFACILDACCSIGACATGEMYFEAMSRSFGIIPNLEHHTCMAVLYSRTGQLDKSIAVVRKMPSSHYLPVWRSLLAACQNCGNTMLGGFAFKHAVELDGQAHFTHTSAKGTSVNQFLGFLEGELPTSVSSPYFPCHPNVNNQLTGILSIKSSQISPASTVMR